MTASATKLRKYGQNVRMCSKIRKNMVEMLVSAAKAGKCGQNV